MSSSVLRFFDLQAGHFPEVDDSSAGFRRRMVNAVLRRSLRLRYERVLERCRPLQGRSILDIGCGPGTYAVRLASLGARRVVGVDFAPNMVDLAKRWAIENGVADRCDFLTVDFSAYQPSEEFDFVVGMGVMDYVAAAAPFVARILQLGGGTIFLSFPKSGGILAWQRRLRYRRKCPLFMYSRADLERLLNAVAPARFEIESVARDWFVTIRGQIA